MEWEEYYRSGKFGLFHFTLRLYSSHSTLSHSIFVYYLTRLDVAIA